MLITMSILQHQQLDYLKKFIAHGNSSQFFYNKLEILYKLKRTNKLLTLKDKIRDVMYLL